MKCPCDSGKAFSDCCEPVLTGTAQPLTAEALMRARYTAYTKVDVVFLRKTLAAEERGDFDAASTQRWAERSEWQGLRVISVKNGGENDKTGTVEFTATFKQAGDVFEHHEISEFRRAEGGQWRFVKGDAHTHKNGEAHNHHEPVQQVIRSMPKIGRNDLCPCGSGKKYKKCCGS